MPWIAVDFKDTKDGRRRPVLMKNKTFFSEQACEAYCDEHLSHNAKPYHVTSHNSSEQTREVKGQLVKEYGKGGTNKWQEALTRAVHKQIDEEGHNRPTKVRPPWKRNKARITTKRTTDEEDY